MAWRKWLVRGVVFFLFGGMATAAYVYQSWTSPASIRADVVAKLSDLMPGAIITLDSANLQLLGGVAIQNLQLIRRDDLEQVVIARFPSATLYHDKEMLLEGKLVIRKIEFRRPTIRVIRNREGRWNIDVFGKPRPDLAIPTIVVSDATILVHDQWQSPDREIIEIKDVNITLMNDPIAQVNFQLKANSPLIGRVDVKGSWQRPTNALGLSIELPKVPLQPPLLQCVAGYVPKLAEHANQLQGNAKISAEFGYHPGNTTPWSHDIRCQWSNGQLQHPRIPLPLKDIEAMLRCWNGELRLESCVARSGNTKLQLQGWARIQAQDDPSASSQRELESTTPEPASFIPDTADFAFDLKIDHLDVKSELFNELPANLRRLNDEYSPRGPIDLSLEYSRIAGRWRKHTIARPQDIVVSFVKFPYPLQHVSGTLEQETNPAAGRDTLSVNLVGYAGSRPVQVTGSVNGEGRTSSVDLKITAENLVIDDQLKAALPLQHQDLAAKFRPAGMLNAEVTIHRDAGGADFANRYLLFFHDAFVRYEEFSYPLESVSGTLDVLPDHWEFREFRGTHQGGTVFAKGGNKPTIAGDQLWVEIKGFNINLDAELESALKPDLKKTWKSFKPAGRMNFVALVDRLPAKPPEIDVAVDALGCSIQPDFFPIRFKELTGKIRYAKRQVYLKEIKACHGQTVLSIDEGKAILKPDGGTWIDVVYLRGDPVQIDDEMMQALPPLMRKICGTLNIRDPFGLWAHLTIDTTAGDGHLPDIYWDGGIKLHEASLNVGIPVTHVTGIAACKGDYFGNRLRGLDGHLQFEQAELFKQPFRDIQTGIKVEPDKPEIVVFPGLSAKIYGGEIYGPARLECRPPTIESGPELKYVLNLTASQIRLEEFARHNLPPGTTVSGQAAASLYLEGEGADLQSLRGRGSLEIPNGRIYSLPFFLDLLKFLNLRLPDGTAFEEAHVRYAIQGPKIHFERLDLYGNPISLRCRSGGMNLVDGSDLNLDFYAVSRIVPMLPPLIKGITERLSENVFLIKARGRLGAVNFETEPIPILVEPLKELLEAIAQPRPR